jgi:AraC-like DNA-binding protein
MTILDELTHCADRKALAGPAYDVNAQRYMSSTINQVLSYIRQNLAGNLREIDVAELSGMSISTFTRFFKRHTGCTFVQYQNRLRLNEACELLMCTSLGVTDICYRVGFNNVSNFNRQFLAQKGIPPSKFRALHRLNEPSVHAQKAAA